MDSNQLLNENNSAIPSYMTARQLLFKEISEKLVYSRSILGIFLRVVILYLYLRIQTYLILCMSLEAPIIAQKRRNIWLLLLFPLFLSLLLVIYFGSSIYKSYLSKNVHPKLYIPVYTKYELIVHKILRRQLLCLRCHLNVLCIPNSNHVFKNFLLKSFFQQKPLSYRNQSIDLHCRQMDWFAMSQVLTERNPRTENCNNNYPYGHATEIKCTYDVQGTSRLLRTSSEQLMYPQLNSAQIKKVCLKISFIKKLLQTCQMTCMYFN